jgi:hypothetical protein
MRHVQTFFGFVKCWRSPIEPVIAEAREDVKMEMPNVLITSGTIVLTRRDALAPKCILQCASDEASRAKEVLSQIVGNVQYVLIVNPRCNKTVAADSRVMVKRNEGKHSRFYQNDRGLKVRLSQCSCQLAERTFVASRGVSHEA